MTSPLVMRDPNVMHGRSCLRGTRFPVSQLQDILRRGGLDEVRREYSALAGWSDELLLRAATYPQIDTYWPESGVDVELGETGEFYALGVYTPDEAQSLIAAIEAAAQAIRDWQAACTVWEREHD